MLLTGGLVRSYTKSLIKDGIEPTFGDQFLHRLNILLGFAALAGVMLIAFGLLFHV